MHIDRLLEIIILLLNNKTLTGKKLADRFGVSVRTIQRDITALTMAGIPIAADAGCNGGYSILAGYKLHNSFVKKEDFNIIIMALKSLSTSYENDRLDTILDKYLSISDSNLPSIFVDYGVTKEGSKIQTSNHILESCINNCQQVSFKYRNTYGKYSDRLVQPLALHFKWYSWYLFAYDVQKKAYRTFKVARIDKLIPDRLHFERTADVEKLMQEHEQEYYKSCEHILVWCPAENINLMEETFPDAKFEQKADGSWVMDLFVPTAEPMWQALLLGLGNSAKVISPDSYRDTLIGTAKKFIHNYDIQMS
ncbi:MAG: transcriptional regulator [Eubacterium sp.]|nr:transcriptional regulator [Eubacterium sp.]